jgi:hypothetical protein
LSFNYVSWKNGLKYGIIDGNRHDNSFFRLREHNLSYLKRFWRWANSESRYNRPFRFIVKFIKMIRDISRKYKMIKLWVCLIILAISLAGSCRYLLTSDERVNLIGKFNELREQSGEKHA